MEYKEYGSKNNDIIILLHGGGLSWWNYIDEILLKYLQVQENFFVDRKKKNSY